MKYDDSEGCYVIVGEWSTQGPIVMETEGELSSYEKARERLNKGPNYTRVCIARLTFVSGNELALLDLKRMQSMEKPT